jgi:hypothetical protein
MKPSCLPDIDSPFALPPRVLLVDVPSSRDMPRQKGHKGRSSIAVARVFAHYRSAFHTAADDGQARFQHKGQGKTSA